MFERVEISNRDRRSHFANENIRRISREEFSIYEYDFKVDVETSELCLAFERQWDLNTCISSIAKIIIDVDVVLKVDERLNNATKHIRILEYDFSNYDD